VCILYMKLVLAVALSPSPEFHCHDRPSHLGCCAKSLHSLRENEIRLWSPLQSLVKTQDEVVAAWHVQFIYRVCEQEVHRSVQSAIRNPESNRRQALTSRTKFRSPVSLVLSSNGEATLSVARRRFQLEPVVEPKAMPDDVP
jgi:hypothetical protein